MKSNRWPFVNGRMFIAMTGYMQLGFVLIPFSQITDALFGAPSTGPENESTILLPNEGNSRRPSVCNNKSPEFGVDGIAYWCGCVNAQCACVEVTEISFCEVANGVSGLLFGGEDCATTG